MGIPCLENSEQTPTINIKSMTFSPFSLNTSCVSPCSVSLCFPFLRQNYCTYKVSAKRFICTIRRTRHPAHRDPASHTQQKLAEIVDILAALDYVQHWETYLHWWKAAGLEIRCRLSFFPYVMPSFLFLCFFLLFLYFFVSLFQCLALYKWNITSSHDAILTSLNFRNRTRSSKIEHSILEFRVSSFPLKLVLCYKCTKVTSLSSCLLHPQ